MKNTNYCGTMSAEVKRVSLKPCTSSASSSVPLDKKKPKDPKTPKEPKSNRFVLELNPENDECNEFSFSDLMKSLDNNAESYNVDPLDPLATNEDEQCLKDLEKHFQQKYGPKKRKRMEDYIDKGLGYDETDPFIDNDEAYDELVPSTLTTQYGGFYINCGELEFRPLSPDKEVNDDEDEDNIRPVVKRKRKMQLISSKRRPSHDLKNKKVKIQIPQGKTVAQMIQQKKIIKPMANEDNDNIEEIEINDSNSNEPVVSTSVCDVIDSVAKGEDEPNGEEKNPSNGSLEADDLKKDGSPISLKLPEGLPNDLNILIERIKRLAYTTHDGKRNFFNDEVNQILFEIERRCRSLAYTNRTQVYSHLSAHLPCTKQTLMSRAKKISTEAFDYELQTALSNIRVIIDVSKTRVFANYQKMMDEAKLKFENNGHNGVESSPIQVPKKIFPFDKQLRKELKSALTAKINLYDQIGAKSHAISLKDYLHDFLDKEIKPIFPKGWMTLEVLKHRSKWIEQILPAEPKQLPSSSQSGPQSTSQSVQPSAQTNQISPQSQVNKVQNQHSPQEKVYKPPMTNPKHDIDSLPNNVTPKPKSLINSHQMANKMSDSLSEGLGTKFIPSNKNTAINSNTSEPINLTSIDLSTKPRSSPKPLNVTASSMTPMNLSHEGCLTKLIEQSLADYPNSSVSSTSNQRNTKTSSLPQTQLPFNEMFAKSFDSTPKKASSPEIIEIASSPEPYPKPATTRVQPNMVSKSIPHSTPQQLSQQKAAVSSSSMNYMRNSDASKKKYTSSGATSLLHSSSKMDQMMRQISSTPIRSTASDTLLTITPVQSKSNDNSVSSSKQSVSQTSSVITSSVTSPTFPFDQHDSAYMEQYVRYLQSVNSNAINLLHQNPMRYMESSPLFTNRNSQNLYFPYTTNTSSTSHRTGNKDK